MDTGERWRLDRGFALLRDLLLALEAGTPPRRAFCMSLAAAFQAPAAVYVRIDRESGELTTACWPSFDEVRSPTIVVEHLWRASPSWFARLTRDSTPTSVSLDPDSLRWRGSVADLLLWELGRYSDIAQLPLHVAGSELRLMALVRRRSFSERDLQLMRTVRDPLAALDHLLDTGGRGHAPFASTPTDGTDGHGDHHLTPREMEVLGMLAEGLLARTIAARMSVSTRTVHKHLGNVYRKLEAHDRLLAVARAKSLGLIPQQRNPDGQG